MKQIATIRRRMTAVGTAFLAAILLCPAAWVATAGAAPAITSYPTGASNTVPYMVAEGYDGAAWFTEYIGGYIGRITDAGTVTRYQVDTQTTFPFGITRGPQSKLWFAERGVGKVASIDMNGSITEVATLPGNANEHAPASITTGSDGNLWVTANNETNSNQVSHIYKMTPSGALTEYPQMGNRNGSSFGITSGPDGALWYAWSPRNGTDHYIVRMATDGTTTSYQLPTASSATQITTGPDGNIWFTMQSVHKIGKMTTAGVVTEYSVPTADSGPFSITTGPDGALWFTESFASKIGRITTSGVITEYAAADYPNGIASFSNGKLWFAGYSDTMNRITLPPTAPVVRVTNPIAGSAVSGAVNITGTINSAANYNLQLYVFNTANQSVVGRYQYNLSASATTTSYGWDTTTVPNGTYRVYLSARDMNGNKDANSTSQVTVTVQN